jgi:c-di-GMP-binding flagellar brake protein YcgR
MNLAITLKIGERIGLITCDKSGDEAERLFSRVTDVYRQDEFEIELPISEGTVSQITNGSVIEFVYFRQNGLYRFTGKVLEVKDGKIPTALVKAISQPTKTQRRGYFRLQTSLPIKVYSLDKNGKWIMPGFDTYTLDISGGGLKFTANNSMEDVLRVMCSIVIKGVTYNLTGKRVRSIAASGQQDAFEIGIAFDELDVQTRDALIGFIFEEQGRLRRKGIT